MTNLQEGAPRISGLQLRRLWFWLPIGAGGLLAALVGLGLLLPLWNGLRRDAQRLADLQGYRDNVALLRSQLSTIDADEEKARDQNARLLNLITGSGDRSTFLAKLDQLASSSGVQLDLYEPQAAEKALPATEEKARAEAAKAKAGKAAPDGSGTTALEAEEALPVEVPGLERYDILLSARGPYPALLTFLQRLESLNVLVAHSDLNLSLEEPRSTDPRQPAPPAAVVLKLMVSLYGRPTAAAPG